jgi:hypothetical protein
VTFRTEFPDFPEADFPVAIPAGFEDSGWHNDVSPSLFAEALNLRIWIDYRDPAQREIGAGKRFIVAGEAETLFQSDEWSEVLSFLASLQEPPPVGSRVKLTRDIENYPVIYAEAGWTGTLVRIDDDSLWVKLDEHQAALDEWDNELQICREYYPFNAVERIA